jgi:flagellar hook assembly protein FlgD
MLLSFSVPQNTDLRLQLYDANGKLVIAKQYRNLPAGPNSLRVETARLPVGSYGVQVMTNTQTSSSILIKI